MGQVYRATDTRLGRDVALKVLPAEMASRPDRLDRFRREARALAALDHPGIVTVHSVEEADGVHFLTMQLVEGQPLDRLIPEDGLPVARIVDLASALAEALAAAHEKGIVHRDLKPANVMVGKDGRVKVLDFGLARMTPSQAVEAPGSQLATDLRTREGVVMGTVPYMSPEQVSGREVDHRSDLFSLGVLLYEMASGQRPFQGRSSAELASSILRDTPPPIGERRSDLPEALARVIGRCLEKDAADRYASARDVLAGLHGATDDRPSLNATAVRDVGFGGRPAIAVLPFANLSADPEQEHFADGLAADLITRLSLFRSFPVIARSSSFAYKGEPVDLRRLSAELGVRYVVEGSVRKAGIRVRVSAQLIDATTGEHVYAKTHDRELTDVFAVQDEISEAIAVSLVGDLQRAEHARARRRPPHSLEAWGLYQRATPLLYAFSPEDARTARGLLERAVALDAQSSTALARLAECGIWEVLFEWTATPERTLQESLERGRRAIALDPLDADAHAVLSIALMVAGDGRGALEAAERALELNPSLPLALAQYAHQSHIAGRPPEESIELVRCALRLSPHDPLEWLFYDVLAGSCLDAGRFDEGLAAGRRLIGLSPGYYWGYLWSAMNAVGLGQVEQARRLVDDGRKVKPALSLELALKCLGEMAPDVGRRFTAALRQSGLE